MTATNYAPAPSDQEAAVLGVLEAAYAAWADNDGDAFAELYTSDATIVLPGVYHDGKEAIRTYMKAGFTGPIKGSRPLDTPQKVRILGDDTAIVVSESAILLAGETEVPEDRKRRATWVLTKHTGPWLITAYHNSPLH